MFTEKQVFLLHALSSVHAGSGSEVGLVDLPIQREKHTGFPKIESSSLKGAIRATVQSRLKADVSSVELVFGNEPKTGTGEDGQSGAISFSDARILLFPVKSMRGIFAWITCPDVLKRFNRELKQYADTVGPLPVPDASTVSSDMSADEHQSWASVSSEQLLIHGKLVLDEYTYTAQVDEGTQVLAQKLAEWLFNDDSSYLIDRLVVLSNDDFNDFVQLFTEVNARIRVEPGTGTVADHALWYEENVPPETVFYSFLFTGDIREGKVKLANDDHPLQTAQDVMVFMKDEQHFPAVFQLGGSSTLGKGIMRRVWL